MIFGSGMKIDEKKRSMMGWRRNWRIKKSNDESNTVCDNNYQLCRAAASQMPELSK